MINRELSNKGYHTPSSVGLGRGGTYEEVSTNPVRILYLDDEVNNLNAFKAIFGSEFDIHLASNVIEARKLIGKKSFPIIISDQRMPDIKGVDFFSQIKEKYPDSMRILLTAYTDTADIIKAINNGHIFSFINKPWDESEIRNVIRAAESVYTYKRRLKEKVVDLKKASMEFDRLIDGVSNIHSMLLSMIGLISLAKTEIPTESQKDYFNSIESCLRYGEQFLLNILRYHEQFSKSNLREEQRLDILIEDCVKEVSHDIDIPIQFETDVSQEARFFANTPRLRFIIEKLTKNIIKMKEGGNTVFLGVHADSERVQFKIRRSGLNFTREQIDKLFGISFNTHNCDKEESHIELYLVKEAMEWMDGEIKITSPEKNTTQFEVVIPNQDGDLDVY